MGLGLEVLGSLVLAHPAHAQDEKPDAAPDPPELVESVAAAYPEAALAARVEGDVVLQLTIDADGSVRKVDVVEPAGHGFDEAARAAALRFRFRPARRAGAAVAARIRTRIPFRLPSEPPAPAAQRADSRAAAEPTNERAAAAPGPTVAPAPPPDTITVRGAPPDARRLQHSAEAVNVIDLRKARRESADLGEVIARTQGVAVRRSGGLGSGTRFSLNGLYDDQIRFFLDGVPLDVAGYPFGFANVPVNLIDRVEVFRGVVPIRFGADALGGAVNLVTDQSYRTRVGASYQVGSYGTRRASVDGRYRHAKSGFVAGATSYFDVATNDYAIDVEVPDARGRLQPARVRRFHDGYLSYGGSAEVGFVERPWARRLLLRAFASTYDKDLQHNAVMTVPYGEVTYGESVYGATARYEQPLARRLELSLVANYARRTIDFVDRAVSVYDWYGQRIRERRIAGEIDGTPTDQKVWQDGVFGRALLAWTPRTDHSVRLALTPTYTTRTGDQRIQSDPGLRDPLTARRQLFTLVSGLEYELNLLPLPGATSGSGGREHVLQNIAFAKSYVYHASTEEVLPGSVFRPLSRDTQAFGVGDGLRVRVASFLYAKASYEYATRLPRPDEVFGNGVLVAPNLELEPETSHNGNVGPRLELRRTPLGDLTFDVNAFWRESQRLIVLLGSDRFFSHQNVYGARGVGVENAIAWVSPGRWLSLDGSLTLQDFRNTSSEGTFGDFDGDRIPNRPFRFGSWGARVRLPGMPGPDDTLEPFYSGRFVDQFFRGWESQGLREFKQVIDSQLTQNCGVSWSVNRDVARITSTFEVQNITDAAVFDFFGVQRPGRAFFLKVTGEI